jgi:hypothetical protein
MERKTKIKIGYFIKENKMEMSTLHQHGILTQNSGKTSKHKSHRNEQQKNKIAHHKLALTHDVSTPRTV